MAVVLQGVGVLFFVVFHRGGGGDCWGIFGGCCGGVANSFTIRSVVTFVDAAIVVNGVIVRDVAGCDENEDCHS